MSHTVRVDVKMTNWETVKAAAAAVGARILGVGRVHLKGWQFPVNIDENGIAAYDNYGGRWGDQKELDKLVEAYGLAAAQKVAHDQGWYSELHDGKLTIFHPTGGVVTVEGSGKIEASNFSGGSCLKATEEIEKALGIESERSMKPEYNMTEIDQSKI